MIVSFLLPLCLLLFPIRTTTAGLTVHVVPHTHDDVGWNKTPLQYFFGANNTIQHAGVQYIIDSMVEALGVESGGTKGQRTFVYCELYYFALWWRMQPDAVRNVVRQLVQSGRLSFVGAGWVQHEEGTTQADALVDQMTLGHQFLLHELNTSTNIGWQIDPFDGHTATSAALMADMGFDGLFFARSDYQDHDKRNETQALELLWRSMPSRGDATDLFTHIFYPGMYCWLPGFAFENEDPPIQPYPDIAGQNLVQRAFVFLAEVQARAKAFQTSHILVLEGCDFAFANSHVNYKNLDLLMDYMNENSHVYENITLIYSTPQRYLAAVHAQDITLPLKNDDFVPYASKPHWYWTGDFTSRPTLKYYVRQSEALLHAASIASTVYGTAPADTGLRPLQEAVAVAQHHDAITGTERLPVAKTYALDIAAATASVQAPLSQTLTGTTDYSLCQLRNESICEPATSLLADGKAVSLVLFNPLAWPTTELLELPLGAVANVSLVDADNASATVPAQVEVGGGARGYTGHTLFALVQMPALGLRRLTLTPTTAATVVHATRRVLAHGGKAHDGASTVNVSSSSYTLTFDASNHSLLALSAHHGSSPALSFPLSMSLFWYNASTGQDESGAVSGAYLFRPNSTKHFPMDQGEQASPADRAAVHTVGPVCESLWTNHSSWAQHEFRACGDLPFVQTRAWLGVIPIGDELGKEIVREWTTSSIASGDRYTSDSNTWRWMERRRNWKPTYDVNVTEPTAGNYVPYSSALVIADNSTALLLAPDRPRGGASLASGQVETMLHRRLLHDDHLGVSEPLNDTSVVSVTERMVVTTPGDVAGVGRVVGRHQLNPALLLVGPTSSAASTVAQPPPAGSRLASPDWPSSVHLLSLDPRPDGQPGALVRIHSEQQTDAPPLTRDLRLDAALLGDTITFNASSLVLGRKVASVTEMSLTAVAPLADVHRLKWRSSPDAPQRAAASYSVDLEKMSLTDMQVRTFVVEW